MSQSGLRWQSVTPRKGLNFLGLLWAPRQKVDLFLINKENAVKDVPAWNHTKTRQTILQEKQNNQLQVPQNDMLTFKTPDLNTGDSS